MTERPERRCRGRSRYPAGWPRSGRCRCTGNRGSAAGNRRYRREPPRFRMLQISALPPDRVDGDHGRLVGSGGELARLARAREHLAARTGQLVIDPLAGLGGVLLLPGQLQIFDQGRISGLVGQVLAVPARERRRGPRHQGQQRVVMHRIEQHRPDGKDEGEQDEQEQRHHEAHGLQLPPPLGPLQLDLQRHAIGGARDLVQGDAAHRFRFPIKPAREARLPRRKSLTEPARR